MCFLCLRGCGGRPLGLVSLGGLGVWDWGTCSRDLVSALACWCCRVVNGFLFVISLPPGCGIGLWAWSRWGWVWVGCGWLVRGFVGPVSWPRLLWLVCCSFGLLCRALRGWLTGKCFVWWVALYVLIFCQNTCGSNFGWSASTNYYKFNKVFLLVVFRHKFGTGEFYLDVSGTGIFFRVAYYFDTILS